MVIITDFGMQSHCCSVAKPCPTLFTPWTAACQASLSFPVSWSLLRFMSIELVMLSNHLILCHPLLLLPSIFPSIRIFSSESALHIRWPKNWSFSISISASSEYSGWTSFRIDWFDLFAVQGTLKSLLSSTTVQKHQFFWDAVPELNNLVGVKQVHQSTGLSWTPTQGGQPALGGTRIGLNVAKLISAFLWLSASLFFCRLPSHLSFSLALRSRWFPQSS